MKECPLLFTIFNTLNANSSWNYLEYKKKENGIYKWNKNRVNLLCCLPVVRVASVEQVLLISSAHYN